MKKIVIIGGGFGGIRTALDLNKQLNQKEAEITLIDKNNYQTFQPSLYEAAAAFGITHDDPYHQLLKSTITISYGDIFENTNVKVAQAEITNINLPGKTVTTSAGHILDFDYLVLALGSEAAFYAIPGVQEYAYKFKNLEDAMKLFEDSETWYQKRSAEDPNDPLKFLVCGAGFNGIELAAELSLCSKHMAHKHKFNSRVCAHITLVEAGPQILPMVSTSERDTIKKRLTYLGIDIMENAPIGEVVDASTVRLKDDRELKADFIVWTAGVKAPELLKTVQGLTLDQSGRIVVNNFLQIQNHENVFAVGDSIAFIDNKTNKPIPQLAYLAIDQAKLVAQNIVRHTRSEKLLTYQPHYNVWVAPVGGKYAVAHVGWLHLTGKLAFILRELIDARYFHSILPVGKALKLIKNRLSVFLKND